MAEDKKEQVEEPVSPLKGTFFDTFEFGSQANPENKQVTAEDIEAELSGTQKEEPKKEDPKKEDDDSTKEEEPKEDEKKEEVNEDIERAVKAIKEKDEKDLDDDEKAFLADYEAGTLEVEEKKEEEEKKEGTGYDTLAKELIDKGILTEAEELEDSEEGFAKVINKTVESKVEEWVNEIPEDYRNILDHLRAGGDVNTYVQARQTIDYDNLDFKNEQVQTALVKAELAQQGHTEEEIEEKLTDLRDLDKMEKEASRAARIFSKQQEDRIAAANAEIETKLQKQEDDALKEVEDVSSAIDKMDEIVGFKLTGKRKDAFKKYLFEVDENGETEASKASKDMENRIKLYFMDFINYDFSDLQKSVTTKKTRDISKILSRYKDTNIQNKGIDVKDKPPVQDPDQFELKLPSIFDQPGDD
jgi:hypothetical protein